MLQTSTKLYKKLQKQYSRRINLDLGRIKKVLERLNNPEKTLNNVVNVIGSDGKNSFLTSLKYFLEANKEKVNTLKMRQEFFLKKTRGKYWQYLINAFNTKAIFLNKFNFASILSCIMLYILFSKSFSKYVL